MYSKIIVIVNNSNLIFGLLFLKWNISCFAVKTLLLLSLQVDMSTL